MTGRALRVDHPTPQHACHVTHAADGKGYVVGDQGQVRRMYDDAVLCRKRRLHLEVVSTKGVASSLRALKFLSHQDSSGLRLRSRLDYHLQCGLRRIPRIPIRALYLSRIFVGSTPRQREEKRSQNQGSQQDGLHWLALSLHQAMPDNNNREPNGQSASAGCAPVGKLNPDLESQT